MPVSVSEGLGKKKLRIRATYSSVITKNSRFQNNNNGGGRNRGREPRGDSHEDDYEELIMRDNSFSTNTSPFSMSQNSHPATFQPSTRGKYVREVCNHFFTGWCHCSSFNFSSFSVSVFLNFTFLLFFIFFIHFCF